jgi:7-carboxy-7-deazaguanine synthase
MNKQPIEKRVGALKDGILSVHSIFRTIQGEGPFCGTPCVFIRLAGCNLQCPACDTEYTEGRRNMDHYRILSSVADLQTGGLVVITGGEPFRQDLRLLFSVLQHAGYYIQVETNGTLAPPAWDYRQNTMSKYGVYIVCSPKTGKVHPDIMEAACALKYVLGSGDVYEDGFPTRALRHNANPVVARPPASWNRPIYIQPMDDHNEERNKRHLEAAVASCLRFGYTLQLQIHKIIGVE